MLTFFRDEKSKHSLWGTFKYKIYNVLREKLYMKKQKKVKDIN